MGYLEKFAKDTKQENEAAIEIKVPTGLYRDFNTHCNRIGLSVNEGIRLLMEHEIGIKKPITKKRNTKKYDPELKEIKTTNDLPYSIKQVSDLLDVPTGTIRQWEKDGLITIYRNTEGHRIYTEEDVFILDKVNKLRNANTPKYIIRNILKGKAITK